MGKKLIKIPQFAYGVIKPGSGDEVEGLCTTGLNTCTGFVATAIPKGHPPLPIEPKSCYHLLCHVDPQTLIKEAVLDWKKSIPENYTIHVYLDDDPERLENYQAQFSELAGLGFQLHYSLGPGNDAGVDRDNLGSRTLIPGRGPESDEEIESPDPSSDYLINYVTSQKIRGSDGPIPKIPILYYDGDTYLTVNDILSQRPDVKEYLEMRNLQDAFIELKEKKYDSQESLLSECAQLINEEREYITAEGYDSDSFIVTPSSLQACYNKYFTDGNQIIPTVHSRPTIDHDISKQMREAQHSMKDALTQMRQPEDIACDDDNDLDGSASPTTPQGN